MNEHGATAALDPSVLEVSANGQESNAAPRFVTGDITPQLLKLSFPVLAVLALQTFVGVAETYFVSFLGTDALAGVALVFPVFMLMTMMSNGGIGGGVSSAVARAVGAGRKQVAEALVYHAVVIGGLCGALFSIGIWAGGPTLFSQLGGEGAALSSAILYASVLFTAAIPGWIANLLGSALRGAGNVRVPALVTACGALVTLCISPVLILGWGWIPSFGVAGAGAALIIFNVGSLVFMILYMRGARTSLRLVHAPLEGRHFRDILRVGIPSAVGTIVANLAVVVTTGLVGTYGRDVIAGYGLASRLDYVLIPLLFAFGTAAVTMVGTNVGAGQLHRARRIAWASALLSGGVTGLIGITVALFPEAWMRLFTTELAVIESGSSYLKHVGPFYALYGVGMALYFASQGAGRMAWPFIAGIVRLVLVALLGVYWTKALDGSLIGLYWLVAVSYLLFGVINALAVAGTRGWGQRQAERA